MTKNKTKPNPPQKTIQVRITPWAYKYLESQVKGFETTAQVVDRLVAKLIEIEQKK